jgi:hypothetical protein
MLLVKKTNVNSKNKQAYVAEFHKKRKMYTSSVADE